MKIAGMILAAALLAPAALSAQGGPGGPGGNFAARMMRSPAAIAVAHKADLNLTDDQVAKLAAIDTAFQAKVAPLAKAMEAARPQGVDFQSMTDEQRQAMRDKMMPIMQQSRELRQSTQEEIGKVLKPEQATKFQEILQQEMPQRGPGGPPPAQG